MKKRWLWLCLLMLLVLIPLTGEALSFQGKKYSKKAEYIDLGDTVVKDFDAFMKFLDQMPNLKQVDMWENRMTREQCDKLAKRYPNMRWGWTMVIKNWDHEHLVRTDYTSWSTLHNNRSAKHGSEDFSVLKYCWDLKALDIGHNKVDNLDFLYDLPDLRVLIIACNAVTDITPIGSLKKLEYAELFNNKITDITPLKNCKHLLDLNLSFNKIKDLSPVKKLKHLQRLWLFSSQQIKVSPPKATVDDIHKALPNTQIDTTHHPTTGTWRYIRGNRKHPHYACIVQMFGEDHLHPRYEYVPFDDSWKEKGKSSPVVTPSPLGDAPALKLKKAQDFSDKKYRLPIDFSAGKKPKKSGYTDKNTYTDSTITVKTGKGNVHSCDYWYADIQLTDASQFRTMAAGKDGSFNQTGEMNAMNLVANSNAVVAMNGDCWGSWEKRGMGYIVRQGILYQNNLGNAHDVAAALMDVLLVNEDGDLITVKKPTKGTIPGKVNGKRILNAFSFGPVLVEDGKAVKNYREADNWLDMAAGQPRQRICLCQTGHLHYLILCCAGPYKENVGMTLHEIADLAVKLGAKTAYNMDGGYSTLLYFNGKRLNESGNKSPRNLMDIIYFASAR